ncbi:peptide chain release factor N(5)-glutamine methyltransferase [Actinophytocola glycyrrhizae]|uniref:Release factor glutamine methyltransferase n=1 Tax=Actinophytocola glycyrrhizae TaxID=2044873 RepID=A0ABV9S8D5_9PSEU
MSRQPLRLAIMEAERILADAGVASPRVDAELIAAHVLGAERGKLMLTPLVDRQVIEAIGQLVHQRAKRIPLQHLLGWAVMGTVTLEVGPGVFVPRPETELLLEWGLDFLAGRENPVVVDLCTGSGALALAVAAQRPEAEVHAVEIDPTALAWARRNMTSSRVRLHAGDVTDPDLITELDARVDLVLCNPPYVPVGTDVAPEVGEHDPFRAVFADDDGLTVIRHVVNLSARLLKPGGAVAIEHDDSHRESVPELLATRKVLTDVADHDDLAGRPRFATAIRTS